MTSTDRRALIDLYAATGGRNWVHRTNWNSSNLSEWYGVHVIDGRVVELHLGDNNLRGRIPSELGNIEELECLRLSGNHLTGRIPAALGRLTNLREINLYKNDLNEDVPEELGNLTSLQKLWLGKNNLSGPIPTRLGQLTQLEELYMWRNQLQGHIPTALGNLTKLKLLALHSNQLGGSIFLEIGNLTALENLYLSNNMLSGNIPDGLQNLRNLKELELQSNQLSGPIPEQLEHLSHLATLQLDNNDLTGDARSFVLRLAIRLQSLDCLVIGANNLENMARSKWTREDLTEYMEKFREIRDVLKNVYDATGGNAWHRPLEGWQAGGPGDAGLAGLVRWTGVTIDKDGHLTELKLENKGLNVTLADIASEVRRLPTLKVLDLSENEDLQGPLPSSWDGLTTLEVLNLRGTDDGDRPTPELPAAIYTLLLPKKRSDGTLLPKRDVKLNDGMRLPSTGAQKALENITDVLDLRGLGLTGEIPGDLIQWWRTGNGKIEWGVGVGHGANKFKSVGDCAWLRSELQSAFSLHSGVKTTALLIAGFSVVNLGQGISARSVNCDDPDAYVSSEECLASQREDFVVVYTVAASLAFTLNMMAVLLLEVREATARFMSNSFSINHFETVYFEKDTAWLVFVSSLLCVIGLAAFLVVCCFLLHFEFDETPAIAGICFVGLGVVAFGLFSVYMYRRKCAYRTYAEQFRRKTHHQDTAGEVLLVFEEQLRIPRPLSQARGGGR